MSDDPKLSPFDNFVSQARQNGYNWDQIHAYVTQRYDKAVASGVDPQKLNAALGFQPDAAQTARMAEDARRTAQANPPTLPDYASPMDNFTAGIKASSGGLVVQGAMGRTGSQYEMWNPSAHAGLMSHLAYVAGSAIGDLPAMIAGGIGAGAAAIETGPGAIPAAGAGAFALPTYIKSEYADAIRNGKVSSVSDYAARQVAVWSATAKQAGVGAITAETGGATGAMLERAGVAAVPKAIIQGSAELATMTATSAALAGQLPSKEDIIDNALVMAAAGGAIHVAGHAPTVAAAADNAMRTWVSTGETPRAQAERALQDPPFRQYQSTPPEAPRWTPPGSARAAFNHTTSAPDSYTIPRAPGNFEAAASWMLKEEGGFVVDTGGPTKYGISGNAHPGVDIKNLSPAQAVKIYHDEYWNALHIDSLPDSMKLRVFDTAINEGVGKAQEFLAKAGTDPVAFDELRKEHYRALADKNPGKYGKYLDTWLARVNKVNGGVSLADGRDLAQALNGGDRPVSENLEPIIARQRAEEAGDPSFLSKFLEDESGAVGRRVPTPAPELDPEETDPFKIVASRMSGATQAEPFGDMLTHQGYKLYLEMMNPDHPIGKLVGQVLDGGQSLPDAKNPYLLQRLAEATHNRATYMLERGMVNQDGAITGPGMKQILEPVEGNAEDRDNFWTYALSKWAREKAGQGKETGVDLPAAMKVIAAMEEGGIKVPGTSVEGYAKSIKTKINWLARDHPEMAFGPHFRIDRNEVNMPNMTDDEFIKAFGRGLTKDVVLAHEVGHAGAFDIADKFGRGNWEGITDAQRTDIEDELTIVSRRFKPGLWADWAQRSHVTKNSELIADAVATWLTDPVARTRMPEFQKLLATEAPGFDLEGRLGAIPEKFGTPAQQAFEQMQDYQNATMKYAYKAGVIGREQYLQSVAVNRAYVPGQRNMEEIQHIEPGGKHSGQNPFNPVNRFKGSDLTIKNIKESIIKDTFLRTSLADHNMVNVAAADAAIPLGLAREERAGRTQIPMSHEDAVSAMGDKGEAMNEDMDYTLAQLAGKSLKTDEVPVMRDGKLTKVVFADPELGAALKGMNKPVLDTWTRLMSVGAKIQRGLIVSNPLFPLHILGYDLPFQFITKPGFRNTVGQAIAGFGHVFGKTDTYDEWMRTGAPDRILEGLSKSDYINKVLKNEGDPHLMDGVFNVVNSPIRALRAWGQNMSQVMPVGRFAQLKGDESVSPQQRAFEASESPFHRSGFGGPSAKKMNAAVPFTTAYMNGLEKSARSLMGLAKEGEQELDANGKPMAWNPKQMALSWAKAAAVITAPILLQEAENHDKHWYKAVPDFVKDNSLVVHLGADWEVTGEIDKAGQPVVIPHGTTLVYKFPPIFSFVFGAIPRRMAAGFLEHDPAATHNILGSAAEGFLPPGGMYPSVLLPFVEHAANWSFFGGHQIVSDNASHNLETQYQYTPYSTATAQALAKAVSDVPLLRSMKLSPPIIDNYLKSWSGTMGEAALHTAENAARSAGIVTNRNAAPHLEDTPFLSSFMVRYPNYSAEPIRRFEDRFDQFAQVHGSLNKMFQEDNFAEFQRILAQNPSMAGVGRLGGKNMPLPADPQQYLQAYTAANKALPQETMDFLQAAKAIQTEQKLVKYITALPTTQSKTQGQVITPMEKRQLLDQHFATMAVMAERANDLADKAGLK